MNKSLIIENIIPGYNLSYHLINKTEDNRYVLIILGWQSVKEIFSEVIEKSSHNFIIFDYPGIGDNKITFKESKKLFKRNLEIMVNALKYFRDNYEIDTYLGTSAGSVFLAKYADILPRGSKLILSSPQLFINTTDKVMFLMFNIFIFIETVFNFPAYKNFLNSRMMTSVWTKIVASIRL